LSITRSAIRVVDDFYPDPAIQRRHALALAYRRPERGFARRTERCHPPRVRQRIERTFGLTIEPWNLGGPATLFDLVNGIFFRHGAGETPYVHHDTPPPWWSLVVYLTPDGPSDAGTSFFRHRATGLAAAPTLRDAKRLGMTVDDLRKMLRRDRFRPKRWLEVESVPFRFNRAVLFRSGLLHSATRYFGSRLADERIYHAFHFPARQVR
jgi:hypothetical protein